MIIVQFILFVALSHTHPIKKQRRKTIMAAINNNTDSIRRAESLQKAQELASQQFGGQLPKEI